MSEVLSSGLTITIPQEGDNNWATSIKNNCFQKISEHDHTGSGKGLQIGTTAIASLAVTGAKIAAGAVSAAKMDIDAIATASIIDGAVTEAKLDADAASRSIVLLESIAAPISGTSSLNVAVRSASNSGTYRITMPKAAKVTHLSFDMPVTAGVTPNTITGGSLEVILYKNGSTTGQSETFTSGSGGSGAITAVSLAAGDTIEFRTTNASLTVSGGTTALICAWGHFTE